jgi:hypothetical protein
MATIYIVSALLAQESACDRRWGSAAELAMLSLFYMTSLHYTTLQRGFTRQVYLWEVWRANAPPASTKWRAR